MPYARAPHKIQNGGKKKNKLGTLDKILIACFIALIIFTITMTVIFCIYQAVPDTLVVSFFAIFTGEAGCCTFIWKHKLKKKDDDLEYIDMDDI